MSHRQAVETRIPLVEEVLSEYENEIGSDFQGYRNHVYRTINFCLAQRPLANDEREKILIAGCFHDIGIWTARTFDYIPPSIDAAVLFLESRGLASWIPQVSSMIGEHHKLREYSSDRLTETFRRGDLIDLSLGIVRCGVSHSRIRKIRSEFPNSGFHRGLVRKAGRWIARHPLNPIPVLKW